MALHTRGMDTRSSLQDRISEEIRVALTRRRMSATELARALGWSRSQISRKLNGQTEISLNDLERIARVLQSSPGDLLSSMTDWRGAIASLMAA
jgi:transcriptional regulator with XRE-family HTH domain